MNGRSGIFKFFLFLFLGVIILLQFLSMIQSDRLYERLNTLIGRLESSASAPASPAEKPTDIDFRLKKNIPATKATG